MAVSSYLHEGYLHDDKKCQNWIKFCLFGCRALFQNTKKIRGDSLRGDSFVEIAFSGDNLCGSIKIKVLTLIRNVDQ